MYRVIIADDEPVIRRGLRETIEWDALGLEVAGEAADGAEALKLIREIRPEILITDIRMPEMDGIELIRGNQEAGAEHKDHDPERLQRLRLSEGRDPARRGQLPSQTD